MKQLFIIMMLFASTSIYSQLSFSESFLGGKTYYNDKAIISEHEFKNILLKNPESEKSYKSYKVLKNTALAIDAFAVASTVYYFTNIDKNTYFAYSGLTFALCAYVIDLSATKRLNKAISAISVSNKGLGLSYRF